MLTIQLVFFSCIVCNRFRHVYNDPFYIYFITQGNENHFYDSVKLYCKNKKHFFKVDLRRTLWMLFLDFLLKVYFLRHLTLVCFQFIKAIHHTSKPKMSLPPTDENENEHPMIARYGKDVFAHLEVIRLIAVSKMNIYQFGDHKQILLKSLFEQMYASLCKHVAKYDKDGKSYDKKSIEEVIRKALEADSINFLPNFDFEEDLIQIPRTIYRNRTEIELGNEERKNISEKTVAVNINNSGETENDDYQNPEKSCAKTFDITNKFSEETTFVVAENEDTALKTLQKENSPEELLIDENDDDLLSNLSLLEISNNSPRIMDRNSRRKGKCFNSTELASTSINVTVSFVAQIFCLFMFTKCHYF